MLQIRFTFWNQKPINGAAMGQGNCRRWQATKVSRGLCVRLAIMPLEEPFASCRAS